MDNSSRSIADYLTTDQEIALTAWLSALILNPDSRVGKLFSPAQFDLVESGLLEIIGHGNGTLEIHIRDRRLTGVNVIKRNKA